jgi:glycosyltransferase involved in cell wall biosynthesis
VNSAPAISVIIPVYNGGAQLGECLDALATSAGDFEIILVDDASTDGSAVQARERGLKVIELASRGGPAAARNRGAREARARILLFIDADVAVRPSTVARVAATFQSRPELAAIFGSYDDAPAAANFTSQYKNLFHHFVHQQGRARAETFWAGCGAVRREIFLRFGGFDEKRYDDASIEDIEFGDRLRRAAHEIFLDKELQVCHLKRWTLLSMLKADIFKRAWPWSSLMLERGRLANDLNLRMTERLSAAVTVAALLLLPFVPAFPFLIALVSSLLLIALALNRKLYIFFLRRRGLIFLFGAVALHLFYYCYSSATFALCCLSHAVRRKRTAALADEVEVSG